MAVEQYDKIHGARWWREIGWRHIVAVAVVLYAVFPIIFVVSVAFSGTNSLIGSDRLFAQLSLDNYRELRGTQFWTWVINSLIIGVITSIGAVLMGAAAAYAFSRFRFHGRRHGLIALMVIQMFPQVLSFVAIFLLLSVLGEVVPQLGLNHRLALIMVYLGGALGVNTFLMYGFFNTVPKELDEAAKVDGASHAQIYWTVILRLVAPILAVVALLSFIGSVSDFIMAKVILQTEDQWTLAVGLFQFVSETNSARWGIFSMGALISAVPVVLLVLFLQRYIVSGLTSGAVKG